MIKLIASDMDGTLLNSKHKICDENLKAIRYAEEKDVIFTIATGRDYESVKPVLDEFNIKCECIVMNGAEYRDIDGNVIENITMNKEHIKIIIETFHKAELSADMLTSDGLYSSNKEFHLNALENRKKYFMEGMTEEEIKELEEHYARIFEPKYITEVDEFINSDIDIYKVMTYGSNEKVIHEVKEKLREIEELAVQSTFTNDIEITDIKAQKGKILAKVIEEKGLERDEVMILGDSFNDYSMFEEFNNSFAMDNGISEVKEIATYITTSNDQAGVAKAIYKMIS